MRVRNERVFYLLEMIVFLLFITVFYCDLSSYVLLLLHTAEDQSTSAVLLCL